MKGYEIADGEHVILPPEEIADAVPDSDKVLEMEAFLPCAEITPSISTNPITAPRLLIKADDAAARPEAASDLLDDLPPVGENRTDQAPKTCESADGGRGSRKPPA